MCKKMTGVGMLILLMSILICGCGREAETVQSEDLPVLVVGCDNYSPFSYADTDGDMTGIDVELAREAFSRMGYAPQFVFIKWEDKRDLLAEGTIDCIWSSFTMTGREDEYHWAEPYMRSRQVVAINEDSDIYTLQDLEDKVIADEAGRHYPQPRRYPAGASQSDLRTEERPDLYSVEQRVCGCIGGS